MKLAINHIPRESVARGLLRPSTCVRAKIIKADSHRQCAASKVWRSGESNRRSISQVTRWHDIHVNVAGDSIESNKNLLTVLSVSLYVTTAGRLHDFSCTVYFNLSKIYLFITGVDILCFKNDEIQLESWIRLLVVCGIVVTDMIK